MRTTFEGSYLGADAKISASAVMECKICWTPYDPAAGDETRQIPPGVAFAALPTDWKCPVCDGPKEQFMVVDDPGAPAAAARDGPAAIADAARRLEAAFREIHHARMRGTPLSNPALAVEAIGFHAHGGHRLGVLVTPWFMNLMLLEGPDDDWSALVPGTKEVIAFPSGAYEFVHNVREGLGGYKACSLFSPMGDFSSQLQAADVARAVLPALFDPANRAETDRSGEIRRAREEAAAAAQTQAIPPDGEAVEAPGEAPGEAAPSRRALLTGNLSGREAR